MPFEEILENIAKLEQMKDILLRFPFDEPRSDLGNPKILKIVGVMLENRDKELTSIEVVNELVKDCPEKGFKSVHIATVNIFRMLAPLGLVSAKGVRSYKFKWAGASGFASTILPLMQKYQKRGLSNPYEILNAKNLI